MKGNFCETELPFSEGVLNVLLSDDFEGNCLSFDPFFHKHLKYELHYTMKGGCELKWGKESLLCSEGHILIVSTGIEHKIYPLSDTHTKTILYMPAKRGSFSSLCPSAPVCIRDGLGMGKRLLRVSTLLGESEPLGKEYVRGEMTLFFADLLSLLVPYGKVDSTVRGENRAEKIVSYIGNHYCRENCSCEELAKQGACSKKCGNEN